MAKQDRTLDHYQELMTINATAHVLRAARTLGVFDQLAIGQKTLDQLVEATGLVADRLAMLLTTLRSIGIIESYGDDFALSSTARLLCQYDRDLGDDVWGRLSESIRHLEVDPGQSAALPVRRFDSIAATQWVHTPAAMQVAEMLDMGGAKEIGGSRDADDPEIAAAPVQLLDLGCGSAVWSCAMAHRDPTLKVVAVDTSSALLAATSTAASIDLMERFETIDGDLLHATLPAATFDWSIIAQRLHCLVPAQIDQVLDRLVAATKPGGRVVVIDSFRGPARASLAESLEALRLMIETHAERSPELSVAEARMTRAGLGDIQFSYIAASRIGLGMMVGTKP